jgi:hypothetical protein
VGECDRAPPQGVARSQLSSRGSMASSPVSCPSRIANRLPSAFAQPSRGRRALPSCPNRTAPGPPISTGRCRAASWRRTPRAPQSRAGCPAATR